MRSSCPQPLQPVPVPCAIGPVEIKFFGMGQSFNITGLLPYANYELCVVSYNNMGSTVSDWVSITTLKEREDSLLLIPVQNSNTVWLWLFVANRNYKCPPSHLILPSEILKNVLLHLCHINKKHLSCCFFVAPQYKEPFVVHSNLTTVFVDWSGSFSLNGPLSEYSLTESNLRIYSGFHSSLHIPRTSDKSMTTMVILSMTSG